MPKISIIVAAYNVEEYLQQCLNSLSNQTFSDFEAIIVNDASTDATAEILDAPQKKIHASFLLRIHTTKDFISLAKPVSSTPAANMLSSSTEMTISLRKHVRNLQKR